ncbi:MAG: hypothetical protein O8C65_04360 [Candidatus Methanoperedens sp.]|nr:hypothetical protein [Candidatus Methanoperedens sp.]
MRTAWIVKVGDSGKEGGSKFKKRDGCRMKQPLLMASASEN